MPGHASHACENARFQLGSAVTDPPHTSFPVLKARLRRAWGNAFLLWNPLNNSPPGLFFLRLGDGGLLAYLIDCMVGYLTD